MLVLVLHNTSAKVVYNLIKTCMTNFTDALDIFTEVRTNVSRCAGKLWIALLQRYPLDDACTRHLLLAREIARAVCPVTDSVDGYNIHSAEVATQLHALSDLTISPSELFALVELSSYKASNDKHLHQAYRDVKKDLCGGKPLSRRLVNSHVKDVIRARRSDKDVRAFSASTDGRCRECKGCVLHCKDHKGNWRSTPSGYSSGGDGGDSDASRRGVRRTKRPDFKALAEALPHSYPATTERDGNDIIAEAKKAAKKAYLMTVAQGIHSDDDEAGITDDDYYDDYDAPIYSKPGDRDKL